MNFLKNILNRVVMNPKSTAAAVGGVVGIFAPQHSDASVTVTMQVVGGLAMLYMFLAKDNKGNKDEKV